MDAATDSYSVIAAVLFVPAFAALWIGITVALGRWSGWTALEAVYPDRADVLRRRFRMQSASFGGRFGMPVNYGGCLTLDACAGGLRVKVWKIFALFGHPVFVPWSDITVDRKRSMFLDVAQVRFRNWQGGEMSLSLRTWNRIVREAAIPGLELR